MNNTGGVPIGKGQVLFSQYIFCAIDWLNYKKKL